MKLKTLLITAALALTGTTEASEPKTIELGLDNFVSLTGVVEESTVSAVINGIESLPADKTIYLYINSPGGNVIEGNRLVEYLLSTKRDVRPVVQMAASMAAVITEASRGVRYITQTGFLMFHHIQGGVEGDIDKMKSRLAFAEVLQEQLMEVMAERAQMSLVDFTKFVGFERFVGYNLAKAHNLIDEKVRVRCAPEIKGLETTIEERGIFGTTTKKKVKLCPL